MNKRWNSERHIFFFGRFQIRPGTGVGRGLCRTRAEDDGAAVCVDGTKRIEIEIVGEN